MDPHRLMCYYSSIGSYKTSSLSGSVTPEFIKSVLGLVNIVEACRLCREIASWYMGPVMLWRKFRSHTFLDYYGIERGKDNYYYYSINGTGPVLLGNTLEVKQKRANYID